MEIFPILKYVEYFVEEFNAIFYLIYVICVCLREVVSHTYIILCCVFVLFVLVLTCVSYVVSFSGLSIFDCPLYSLTFICSFIGAICCDF